MGEKKPNRAEMTQLIQRSISPVSRIQRLPFDQACGRICAEDVAARNTLPNTPVSRFDGIAVRYDQLHCGAVDPEHLVEGRDFAYCNTGIAMPEGFDTVVAIEEVEKRPDCVCLRTLPQEKGQLVNQPGSQMQAGECLAARGEVLTPAHIGLLASGGVAEVAVYAVPEVAVIPTGDELVPPCGVVPRGKNVESNSYMIAAYLRQWGAQPVLYPIQRDDPQVIRTALHQALERCDAAVIIAGSSLGTRDYTVKVLAGMGRVLAPELAHGPGRKSSLSLVEGKPVLGVAGPPLGAQITCDLYLAPFVSALRGLPHVPMATLEVISDDEFRPYEVDFCERVHIYRGADGFHIRSVFAPVTTRAQMQALANGNYYRKAGTSCRPGERTEVELLCPLEWVPDRDRLPEVLKAQGSPG